jgi:hypothetical protein
MLFTGSFCMKFFCVLQSKATLKYPLMQARGIRWLSCDLCLGGEKVAEVFILVVHFRTVIMELTTKFFPRMCSKQIRILCIVGYKFNVIWYANKQGNRTAERHF